MERWVVKIFALIGTFILPFLSTLLPYRVSAFITKKGDFGKRVLSYMMCFGGGIFFGTYLLHMGPEVRTLLNDSLMVPYNITYPVPDLITGIGFFVVLFAEKIVLNCNKRRLAKKRQSLCRNDAGSQREIASPQPTVVLTCTNPENACEPCIMGLPCSGDDQDHVVVEHRVDETGAVKLLDVTDIEDLSSKHQQGSCDSDACPFKGSGDCCCDDHTKKLELKPREKQILLNSKVAEAENAIDRVSGGHRHSNDFNHHHLHKSVSGSLHSAGGHGHSHGGLIGTGGHSTRSIVLILALSLHRIFEGMSVGLQMSNQAVIHLFLAVMCHETVIGFSLGLQFVKSGLLLRKMVVTTLICSLIMPFGVAIGTIMTETGHQSRELDMANGLLQAFAMGTFIYVTFFEILHEEVDAEDTSVGKIIFIALGFVMMALLTLIPEEEPLGSVHPTSASPFSALFTTPVNVTAA